MESLNDLILKQCIDDLDMLSEVAAKYYAVLAAAVDQLHKKQVQEKGNSSSSRSFNESAAFEVDSIQGHHRDLSLDRLALFRRKLLEFLSSLASTAVSIESMLELFIEDVLGDAGDAKDIALKYHKLFMVRKFELFVKMRECTDLNFCDEIIHYPGEH